MAILEGRIDWVNYNPLPDGKTLKILKANKKAEEEKKNNF